MVNWNPFDFFLPIRKLMFLKDPLSSFSLSMFDGANLPCCDPSAFLVFFFFFSVRTLFLSFLSLNFFP